MSDSGLPDVAKPTLIGIASTPDAQAAIRAGLTPTALPADLAGHPELAAGYFFTLPADLLNAISQLVGPAWVDTAALELERRLSALSGRHDARVGFFRGQPIAYAHMEPPQPLPTIDQATVDALGWGLTDAQVENDFRILQRRIDAFGDIGRGYAGWLITNPTFLEEQDQLLAAHRAVLQPEHMASLGRILIAEQMPAGTTSIDDPSLEACHEAFMRFLIRWRLVSLAAPDLPTPMEPFMAGKFPISVIQQLTNAGGLFNLPDTFPLPARDELRAMLVEALRPTDDVGHLAEWHGFVRPSNPARNQLDRYARIRRLAHYWRALHRRHAQSFRGHLGRLHEALAKYFHTSDDTIRGDLRIIKERLGSDWESRDPWTLRI